LITTSHSGRWTVPGNKERTGSQPENGKTIKLKGKTLMLSPANYRLQMQISVDGGPYTNFGNPWFRRVESNPAE
jgi:hypothetical protein